MRSVVLVLLCCLCINIESVTGLSPKKEIIGITEALKTSENKQQRKPLWQRRGFPEPENIIIPVVLIYQFDERIVDYEHAAPSIFNPERSWDEHVTASVSLVFLLCCCLGAANYVYHALTGIFNS